MREALKKVRKLLFTIVVLEAFLYIGLATLHYFDIPKGFQELSNEKSWILALGVVIGANGILFWACYLRISRLRQKIDLNAAALLGEDVQEAYNFGEIGLILTDEDGTVIWHSDIFKDRNFNILDENIYNLYPSLTNLQDSDSDSVGKLNIEQRTYQVKHIRSVNLFILKDITDYEMISAYSRDQALVLGIITIDNFNEVAGSEEDSNEIFVKVRQEINEYARRNGVLLRRFKTDSYLAICNYVALQKMIADQFSLHASIRAIGAEDDVQTTVSMGFAYDFPDVAKLNEMANNALDIAFSRGGDQTVVSKYDDDLKFFGGNTASQESSSNVKLRYEGDSIISLIKGAKSVFVMGHTDMDMDALGGCLGIYTICKHLDVPCSIVCDKRKTERKTKAVVEDLSNQASYEELFISSKIAEEKIKSSTLLIVVDTSNPRMVMDEALLDLAAKVVIVDHHRRSDEFIDHSVLSFIKPSASSVTEMLCGAMKYCSVNPKIQIQPEIATIMLSGIFLDSNFFKSSTTSERTFDAAEMLKLYGADNGEADDYLKDEFEEYSLITSITSTMKTPYFGVVYCLSDNKDIVERSTLSRVANQVMQLKGVHACFVIGRTSENEVRMSARSNGSINVQFLTEKLGGGGHFTSAAVAFNNEQDVKNVEQALLDTLEEYLNSARAE